MGKQGGLGQRFYVGGFDISGDVSAMDSVGVPIATLDSTGIDKSAHERLLGLRDGNLAFTSIFNTSAGQQHKVLDTLPRTDVGVMWAAGVTIGSPAFCMIAKQVNYDGTRNAAGLLNFKTQTQANAFGADWGELLTAGKRVDTTATAGSPFDGAAATAFGFTAYLQVFAFTGTDVTVKLQDATTSGGSYADITSGAFAQITAAPAVGRIAVGGTGAVREFVKATTVTTGGFTSATFAVVLVRNQAAVRV